MTVYIRRTVLNLFVLGIISLAVFIQSSCGRRDMTGFDSRLLHADSLCNTDPESARKYLAEFHSGDFDGRDSLFYQLLCIKSDAKLGIVQTSDVHIGNILRGLENVEDRHLLAETYFYAGIVYRDLGDSPKALEYFNDAAEVSKDIHDLRLRSNICSQKGNVLITQGLMEMAIGLYSESVRLDSLRGDTTGMVLGYRNLAYAYNEVEDTVRCKHIMDDAIMLARKAGLADVESNIRVQFAGIYANNRQFVEARRMLGDNAVAEGNIDFSPYLYICAQIYSGLGMQDSLFYCSQKMMKDGGIEAKAFACRNLARIYMDRSQIDSARRYMDLYDVCSDSLRVIEAAEITARMNAAFNYKSKENELSEKKVENMNRVVFFTMIIAIVLSLLLIALYVLLKMKEKNRQQLKLANSLQNKLFRQTEEYTSKLEKDIEEMTAIEQELNAERNRNSELRQVIDYKNQLLEERKMVENEKENEQKAMEVVVNSEIYKDIIAALKAEKNMPDADWQRLDTLANSVFPGFRQRLYASAKLSVQEYRTCLLLKVGLSISDIAKLTLRVNNSVSMLRKRLAVKMFGDGCSASDLDNYIKAL